MAREYLPAGEGPALTGLSETPCACTHSCISSATVPCSIQTRSCQTACATRVSHLHPSPSQPLQWGLCSCTYTLLLPLEQSTPPASDLALLCTLPICVSVPLLTSRGFWVLLPITFFSVLALMDTSCKTTGLCAGKHQNAVTLTGRPLQTQHIKWVTTAVISVTQLRGDCLAFSLPLKSLECKQVKLKQGGNKMRMRNGEGKGKHPTVLVWGWASSQLQRAGSPELRSWRCCRN